MFSKTIAFQIISSFAIVNTQVTDLFCLRYKYSVNHFNMDRVFLCCFAYYHKIQYCAVYTLLPFVRSFLYNQVLEAKYPGSNYTIMKEKVSHGLKKDKSVLLTIIPALCKIPISILSILWVKVKCIQCKLCSLSGTFGIEPGTNGLLLMCTSK